MGEKGEAAAPTICLSQRLNLEEQRAKKLLVVWYVEVMAGSGHDAFK